MKTNFLTLSTLSTLLTALIVSCSGQKRDNAADTDSIILAEQPEVKFEGYNYDVVARIADADSIDAEGWQYCRATGQGVMPTYIYGHDIEQLRDTLSWLGGIRFTSATQVEPMLTDNLVMTDLDPKETPACSNSYRLLSLSLLTPQLVVWKAYAAGYSCEAAHGSYYTQYVNYRIADGTILSLDDIIAPELRDSLTHKIRERIIEDKIDLLVPLDSVQIPQDFQLSTTGVDFIYSLYEIAPFAAGEVSVKFDAYEIEDFLRPGVMSLIYGNRIE